MNEKVNANRKKKWTIIFACCCLVCLGILCLWRLYLISLPILLLCILASFAAIKELLDSIRSINWENTDGRVISSRIKVLFVGRSSTPKGKVYEGIVKYSYTIGDQKYIGDKVRFGYGGSSNAIDATKVLTDLSSGKRIKVYYNPNKPHHSVLIVGANRDVIASCMIVLGVSVCTMLFCTLLVIYGI